MTSATTIKTYLSGPVDNAADPTRWRRDVQEACNFSMIAFIDPVASIGDGDGPVEIVRTESDDPNEYTPEQLVRQQLGLLKQCDTMLAKWPTEQIQLAGMPIEMAYAHRGYDIPVVVYYEGPQDDLSPWVRFHASAVKRTAQDSFEALVKKL